VPQQDAVQYSRQPAELQVQEGSLRGNSRVVGGKDDGCWGDRGTVAWYPDLEDWRVKAEKMGPAKT
jgi:hypothetical protein